MSDRFFEALIIESNGDLRTIRNDVEMRARCKYSPANECGMACPHFDGPNQGSFIAEQLHIFQGYMVRICDGVKLYTSTVVDRRDRKSDNGTVQA